MPSDTGGPSGCAAVSLLGLLHGAPGSYGLGIAGQLQEAKQVQGSALNETDLGLLVLWSPTTRREHWRSSVPALAPEVEPTSRTVAPRRLVVLADTRKTGEAGEEADEPSVSLSPTRNRGKHEVPRERNQAMPHGLLRGVRAGPRENNPESRGPRHLFQLTPIASGNAVCVERARGDSFNVRTRIGIASAAVGLRVDVVRVATFCADPAGELR
jgi:hypothetical protein